MPLGTEAGTTCSFTDHKAKPWQTPKDASWRPTRSPHHPKHSFFTRRRVGQRDRGTVNIWKSVGNSPLSGFNWPGAELHSLGQMWLTWGDVAFLGASDDNGEESTLQTGRVSRGSERDFSWHRQSCALCPRTAPWITSSPRSTRAA